MTRKAHVSTDIGPFAMVPEWLLFSNVSAGAIRVFAVLHRHEGEGGIYPSRKRLAELMGCSVDSVDRYVRELVEAGAVTVMHRTGDLGDPTSNLYDLHFLRPGSRMAAPRGGGKDAVTGSRIDAATGGGKDAAQTKAPMNESPLNESQGEREYDTTEPIAVREMRASVLAVLPRKYSSDPLTFDEATSFAEDYQGQELALAEAVKQARRDQKLPFPQVLRGYMPEPASTEPWWR